MRGSYTILLRVPEDRSIKIGKIGIKQFSKGYYAYIGSALNGIENRLKRHMKSDKKLHWHIDYLLQHSDIDLIYYKASKTKPCGLSQLFDPQWSDTAGFFLTQGKNIAYHPAEIMG